MLEARDRKLRLSKYVTAQLGEPGYLSPRQGACKGCHFVDVIRVVFPCPRTGFPRRGRDDGNGEESGPHFPTWTFYLVVGLGS